jgi:hypothetical protein
MEHTITIALGVRVPLHTKAKAGTGISLGIKAVLIARIKTAFTAGLIPQAIKILSIWV